MLKNTINHLSEKNRESVKQSEIITYQPNTFENPNTFDIKSVITGNSHSRNSQKLSKTITSQHKPSRGFPLCSYFRQDIPDHNRTKIGRISFLTYFCSAMSDMHLHQEKFPKSLFYKNCLS